MARGTNVHYLDQYRSGQFLEECVFYHRAEITTKMLILDNTKDSYGPGSNCVICLTRGVQTPYQLHHQKHIASPCDITIKKTVSSITHFRKICSLFEKAKLTKA